LWSLLTNAVLFFVLLLCLRFSKRQKDLSLGALLMFLFSVLTNFAVPVLELNNADTVQAFGKVSLGVLTAALALILVAGQPLMQLILRSLFNLFTEERASTPAKGALPGKIAEPAALPAPATPVVPLGREGVTTSKVAQPASIIESTTHLLDKEQ
jgi:hypothetical protein